MLPGHNQLEWEHCCEIKIAMYCFQYCIQNCSVVPDGPGAPHSLKPLKHSGIGCTNRDFHAQPFPCCSTSESFRFMKFDHINMCIICNFNAAQEAQQLLSEVITAQQVTKGAPHQGRAYLARLRAEAAEARLAAVKLRLEQLRVGPALLQSRRCLQAAPPERQRNESCHFLNAECMDRGHEMHVRENRGEARTSQPSVFAHRHEECVQSHASSDEQKPGWLQQGGQQEPEVLQEEPHQSA